MSDEIKRLKKRIPKNIIFIKNLENDLLDDFDEYNDNFQVVKKYSKEYNLMREYIKKLVKLTTVRYSHYSKNKVNIYKKIKNLRRYEALGVKDND